MLECIAHQQRRRKRNERTTRTIYRGDVDPEDEPTFASSGTVVCWSIYDLAGQQTPLHTYAIATVFTTSLLSEENCPPFSRVRYEHPSSGGGRVVEELWHKWNYSEHTPDICILHFPLILSRLLQRLSITDVITK